MNLSRRGWRKAGKKIPVGEIDGYAQSCREQLTYGDLKYQYPRRHKAKSKAKEGGGVIDTDGAAVGRKEPGGTVQIVDLDGGTCEGADAEAHFPTISPAQLWRSAVVPGDSGGDQFHPDGRRGDIARYH